MKYFLSFLIALLVFGPLMAALIWGTWGMVGAACIWCFITCALISVAANE
jgi:hypothetical protein